MRLAAGALVLIVLLLGVGPALAQDVGLFIRASCSQINAPVEGQTFCFGQNANALHAYRNGVWVPLVSATGSAVNGIVITAAQPFGTITGGAVAVSALNVASASYLNGIPIAAASPSLINTQGISTTSVGARNLRGTCTFAAAVTCAVAFPTNESDATYFVATSCPVTVGSKTASGFTMTATGTNSNSCDYLVVR